MRRLLTLLPFYIAITLLAAGCANEKEDANTVTGDTENSAAVKADAEKEDNSLEENEKEAEEPEEAAAADIQVDPLPTTYKELEALPPGQYTELIPMLTEEEQDAAVEKFKDLPDIKDDPTQEELDFFYQELLKRVQRDYKGPEDLIKQLKFQSLGDPEMEDTRYQFKENLNVEIILDASGSMAQDAGGNTKMAAAKQEIKSFVESLPPEANVGLRVYGHKGSNADSDKELSCGSSEMLYSISPYEAGKFQSALDQVEPTGWTPITLAMEEAAKDLSKFDGENHTNIVYLVSDGIETCDGDPVSAAKSLFDSNLKPIINVIGFDVDADGQKQLKDIADATEGIYENVQDQEALKKELEKINAVAESWEQWKEKGEDSIELKEVTNSLDIFGYITWERSKATDENSQINLITSNMQRRGYMSTESRVYLQKKNKEYHDWIRSEIERFKSELNTLNEKNYQEAKKALEEKYQLNTQ
jgi:Ca-activated chloride channel homolog